MALKEEILGDVREALKEQDAPRAGTLRMLSAAIHNREIEKRGKTGSYDLTEEEVQEVVQREAKKRREAIELYEKGSRAELAEKERAELKVLERYLPAAMETEELKACVEGVVARLGATGPTAFGKVMGEVMKEVKGRADAKAVGELVRERLSSP